jgi:hypothetical protein
MAIVIFSFSCGSNETKTDTATDTTAANTSTPASTITTAPITMMAAMHKVKDFDTWLASYEANDSLRLANGVHNFMIGRGAKDPDMVLVVVSVDDLAKAKAFSKDASLKQAMQKGGVSGTPTFKFVTLTFRDTAQISSALRSYTSITVKDWDMWQKSFDSTRQVTTDNGLAVRAYGYDPDDNHKVTIVSAILDSSKAAAYWNSDMLKQRRAASGAGEPSRFVYTMVKMY